MTWLVVFVLNRLGVFVAANISGDHLNPTVTLGLAVGGILPLKT